MTAVASNTFIANIYLCISFSLLSLSIFLCIFSLCHFMCVTYKQNIVTFGFVLFKLISPNFKLKSLFLLYLLRLLIQLELFLIILFYCSHLFRFYLKLLSLFLAIFWNQIFFFLSFQGCICGIWRFPGQGLNQSCGHWSTPQPQQHGYEPRLRSTPLLLAMPDP